MIQLQELRIGNCVRSYSKNDLIFTVKCLNDTFAEIEHVDKDGTIYNSSVDYENLIPIPLTEEILLKFRYKKIRDNEFLFDNHFIIFIKESEIDFGLFNSEGNDFFVCEFLFAHELQNLHYSIRKEELKFKQTT